MLLHKTKIDLSLNIRKKSVKLLQKALSSSIDLSLHAKQAHWNVKGMSFIALHELFDKIHEKVGSISDMIAERITAFAADADGTLKSISDETLLNSYPNDINRAEDHIEALSNSLAAFGKYVRASIESSMNDGDIGTSDLFTEVSRDIDHLLWLVEAHVQ